MKNSNAVVKFTKQNILDPDTYESQSNPILLEKVPQQASSKLEVLVKLHHSRLAEHRLDPLLLDRIVKLYLALGCTLPNFDLPKEVSLLVTSSTEQVQQAVSKPPSQQQLAHTFEAIRRTFDLVFSGLLEFLPRSITKPWQFEVLEALRQYYSIAGKHKQSRKVNTTLTIQLKGTLASKLCKLDDNLACSILRKYIRSAMISAQNQASKSNYVGAIQSLTECVVAVENSGDVRQRLTRELSDCYSKMAILHRKCHYTALATRYQSMASSLNQYMHFQI